MVADASDELIISTSLSPLLTVIGKKLLLYPAGGTPDCTLSTMTEAMRFRSLNACSCEHIYKPPCHDVKTTYAPNSRAGTTHCFTNKTKGVEVGGGGWSVPFLHVIASDLYFLLSGALLTTMFQRCWGRGGVMESRGWMELHNACMPNPRGGTDTKPTQLGGGGPLT